MEPRVGDRDKIRRAHGPKAGVIELRALGLHAAGVVLFHLRIRPILMSLCDKRKA